LPRLWMFLWYFSVLLRCATGRHEREPADLRGAGAAAGSGGEAAAAAARLRRRGEARHGARAGIRRTVYRGEVVMAAEVEVQEVKVQCAVHRLGGRVVVAGRQASVSWPEESRK